MPPPPRLSSLPCIYLRLTLTLINLALFSSAARAKCVARLPTFHNPSNGTSLNGTAPNLATSQTPNSRAALFPSFNQINPLPPSLDWSNRIINGILAPPVELDNVATITSTRKGQYICAGSLIAPQWVLTAARCELIRRSNKIRVGGEHALTGEEHEVEDIFFPDAYEDITSKVRRADIMLVKLVNPIAIGPSPSPKASPLSETPDGSGQNPSTDATSANPSNSPSPAPPSPTPYYNFMRINTNRAFGVPPAPPRYLRLKGYGMTAAPGDTDDGLFGPRQLRFADIKTAPCGGEFGSDGGRRICTAADRKCGPCFGDTGSPLYDVDASGTTGVIVGILTFEPSRGPLNFENPACVEKKPVLYTAVAPYVDWIRRTVGNDTVQFYELPPSGITNTRLAPEPDSFPVSARISLIVVSSLALIAALTALLVTCVLRHLRRRRRRWIEGLHAEDSFVRAGEKHAAILDPFEGITDDQRHARPSITGIPRAAFTGATEFSARSMQKLKALIKRAEEEEEALDETSRLPVENGPGWLNGAWDRLFRPPSKIDTDSIHRVPTQRIVDDVLEGGDKSVEPSLESVAYKSARDELNLELAWQRLEIKTSLRNMSEASGGHEPSLDLESIRDGSAMASASGTNTGPSSPPPRSPRRQGSRNSSRNISRSTSNRGTSSPSSATPRSGRSVHGRRPDIGKADALLAAFASIDAESEHVAEETVIDSSALRALAAAKRPTLFEALRRKLSQPGLHSEGREDRIVDSDGEIPRAGPSHVRGSGSGWRTGSTTPDSVRMSPRSRMSSAGSLQRAHSSRASSSAGASSPAMLSRQSSMHMDYFSREYEVSGSESDHSDEEMTVPEEQGTEASDGEGSEHDISGSNVALRRGVSGKASRISFEKSVWGGERDMEDRTDGMDSRFVASRSTRVAQVRSFEALDNVGSERSSSFGEGLSVAGHAPEPPVETVLPEGTEVQSRDAKKELGSERSGKRSERTGGSNDSGTTVSGGDDGELADGEESSGDEGSSVMKLKHMWSEIGRREGARR